MRKSFPFSGAPHYEWNVKQVKTNTGENISTSPQRIILHCSKWIWIPLASDKTASRFSFAMCWHGTCGDVCNLAFRHSCCWIWRTYKWHNKMKKKPCFGPCGLYLQVNHWVRPLGQGWDLPVQKSSGRSSVVSMVFRVFFFFLVLLCRFSISEHFEM